MSNYRGIYETTISYKQQWLVSAMLYVSECGDERHYVPSSGTHRHVTSVLHCSVSCLQDNMTDGMKLECAFLLTRYLQLVEAPE